MDELLDIMVKSTSEDYRLFLMALVDTKQLDVVTDILKEQVPEMPTKTEQRLPSQSDCSDGYNDHTENSELKYWKSPFKEINEEMPKKKPGRPP